jgi:hypothetical protein
LKRYENFPIHLSWEQLIMTLSTNSVFHFTKSIDAVKGILASRFRIKYCLETIESKDKTIEYAVPMASFCDIPLSQVTSHIDKYGGYGIGLFKRWAKRKGLNPVLYLEKNATILNDVLIREKFENSQNNVVQEFLRYTKNYEGQLFRDGELIQKNYRYFDEREWRYCPSLEELNGEQLIIHDTLFYKHDKQIINERLWELGLGFTMKDVSYIIVKDDEEIIDIINHLETLIRNEKERNFVKILTSRIMTSKQIRSDF